MAISGNFTISSHPAKPRHAILHLDTKRWKTCQYVTTNGEKCGVAWIAGSGIAKYCDLHRAIMKKRMKKSWDKKDNRLHPEKKREYNRIAHLKRKEQNES